MSVQLSCGNNRYAGAVTVTGEVNQNGTFTCLGRIVSLDGTGEQVGNDKAPCIAQADVSAITAKVWFLGNDPGNQTPTAVSPDPTVTVSSAISDTLLTNGWDTGIDSYGYNFRFDVAATYPTVGDAWYQIEFRILLTSGTVIWLRYKVHTLGVF